MDSPKADVISPMADLNELVSEDAGAVRLRISERTAHAFDELNLFVGHKERLEPHPDHFITVPKSIAFEEWCSLS